MARPQKNNVDYFRHFTHQEEIDAIDILWKTFKKDGYALYYRLREKLGHSDGHFLDLRNPIKWRQFIAYLDVDEVSTVEIINLLVEIGEIDVELWENRIIWWQSYVDDLAEVYENRKRDLPLKPVFTDNNEVVTPNYPVSNKNKGVSAGERKGEEKRGEERGGTSSLKKRTKVQKKSTNKERGTRKTALSSGRGNGKKKVNPSIIKVEKFLEAHRAEEAGLETSIVSPEPELEREYISLMLDQGFTVEEICSCYNNYKTGIRISSRKPIDTYWVDKFLSMKSVYKQIADWRKRKRKSRDPLINPDAYIQGKYGHLVHR